MINKLCSNHGRHCPNSTISTHVLNIQPAWLISSDGDFAPFLTGKWSKGDESLIPAKESIRSVLDDRKYY
jgi:hypothetical protein